MLVPTFHGAPIRADGGAELAQAAVLVLYGVSEQPIEQYRSRAQVLRAAVKNT